MDKFELCEAFNYLRDNNFIPILAYGKKPINKQWQTINETNCSQLFLNTLFYNEICNIGIQTGKNSGVIILDIEKEGKQDFLELCPNNKYPKTPRVITGNNGYHFYFQYDETLSHLFRSRSRPIPNLAFDVKGDGGFVVAPPSIHPITNKRYQWFPGYLPTDINFQPIPQWLIKILEENESKIELKIPLKIQSEISHKLKISQKVNKLSQDKTNIYIKQSIEALSLYSNNSFLFREVKDGFINTFRKNPLYCSLCKRVHDNDNCIYITVNNDIIEYRCTHYQKRNKIDIGEIRYTKDKPNILFEMSLSEEYDSEYTL